MKIVDYISKAIQEYPSLYKDTNYEKSKMKVLDHIFFTIGNGLEMAKPADGEEGGYVVDPKYKKNRITDEWERRKDKPYGKERYKKIPDTYFDDIVYYVYAGIPAFDVVVVDKDGYGKSSYIRYDKRVNKEHSEPRLYKAESNHPFSPYPFSKEHSLACEVFYKGVFIQPDWMEELIKLCERTQIYFANEDEYSNNVYYPSESRIKSDLRAFQKRYEESSGKGIKDLRKIWGYQINETVPDFEEIRKRKTESWEKFRKSQIQFLTKFIKKFKKSENENKSNL